MAKQRIQVEQLPVKFGRQAIQMPTVDTYSRPVAPTKQEMEVAGATPLTDFLEVLSPTIKEVQKAWKDSAEESKTSAIVRDIVTTPDKYADQETVKKLRSDTRFMSLQNQMLIGNQLAASDAATILSKLQATIRDTSGVDLYDETRYKAFVDDNIRRLVAEQTARNPEAARVVGYGTKLSESVQGVKNALITNHTASYSAYLKKNKEEIVASSALHDLITMRNLPQAAPTPRSDNTKDGVKGLGWAGIIKGTKDPSIEMTEISVEHEGLFFPLIYKGITPEEIKWLQENTTQQGVNISSGEGKKIAENAYNAALALKKEGKTAFAETEPYLSPSPVDVIATNLQEKLNFFPENEEQVVNGIIQFITFEAKNAAEIEQAKQVLNRLTGFKGMRIGSKASVREALAKAEIARNNKDDAAEKGRQAREKQKIDSLIDEFNDQFTTGNRTTAASNYLQNLNYDILHREFGITRYEVEQAFGSELSKDRTASLMSLSEREDLQSHVTKVLIESKGDRNLAARRLEGLPVPSYELKQMLDNAERQREKDDVSRSSGARNMNDQIDSRIPAGASAIMKAQIGKMKKQAVSILSDLSSRNPNTILQAAKAYGVVDEMTNSSGKLVRYIDLPLSVQEAVNRKVLNTFSTKPAVSNNRVIQGNSNLPSIKRLY